MVVFLLVFQLFAGLFTSTTFAADAETETDSSCEENLQFGLTVSNIKFVLHSSRYLVSIVSELQHTQLPETFHGEAHQAFVNVLQHITMSSTFINPSTEDFISAFPNSAKKSVLLKNYQALKTLVAMLDKEDLDEWNTITRTLSSDALKKNASYERISQAINHIISEYQLDAMKEAYLENLKKPNKSVNLLVDRHQKIQNKLFIPLARQFELLDETFAKTSMIDENLLNDIHNSLDLTDALTTTFLSARTRDLKSTTSTQYLANVLAVTMELQRRIRTLEMEQNPLYIRSTIAGLKNLSETLTSKNTLKESLITTAAASRLFIVGYAIKWNFLSAKTIPYAYLIHGGDSAIVEKMAEAMDTEKPVILHYGNGIAENHLIAYRTEESEDGDYSIVIPTVLREGDGAYRFYKDGATSAIRIADIRRYANGEIVVRIEYAQSTENSRGETYRVTAEDFLVEQDFHNLRFSVEALRDFEYELRLDERSGSRRTFSRTAN